MCWPDLALVGLLVILELAGFGQDPGIGAAAMTLELAPILALLVGRVSPQVVAVTYLLANGSSALLDLHAVNSASIVVTIVVGVYSAGAYLPLVWSLPTLGLWAAWIGIDFVTGRETGRTDLISPGSSWPAPSLLAKKTVRSRTRVPDLGCCGVGLRGLEPLTSSLSGKRSNRLSYRPGRTALCLGRLSHRALTSQPRSVLCQGDLDASQQACRQVVHEGAKRCDGGD